MKWDSIQDVQSAEELADLLNKKNAECVITYKNGGITNAVYGYKEVEKEEKQSKKRGKK